MTDSDDQPIEGIVLDPAEWHITCSCGTRFAGSPDECAAWQSRHNDDGTHVATIDELVDGAR